MTVDAVLHILVIALIILIPIALVVLIVWRVRRAHHGAGDDGEAQTRAGRSKTKTRG